MSAGNPFVALLAELGELDRSIDVDTAREFTGGGVEELRAALIGQAQRISHETIRFTLVMRSPGSTASAAGEVAAVVQDAVSLFVSAIQLSTKAGACGETLRQELRGAAHQIVRIVMAMMHAAVEVCKRLGGGGVTDAVLAYLRQSDLLVQHAGQVNKVCEAAKSLPASDIAAVRRILLSAAKLVKTSVAEICDDHGIASAAGVVVPPRLLAAAAAAGGAASTAAGGAAPAAASASASAAAEGGDAASGDAGVAAVTSASSVASVTGSSSVPVRSAGAASAAGAASGGAAMGGAGDHVDDDEALAAAYYDAEEAAAAGISSGASELTEDQQEAVVACGIAACKHMFNALKHSVTVVDALRPPPGAGGALAELPRHVLDVADRIAGRGRELTDAVIDLAAAVNEAEDVAELRASAKACAVALGRLFTALRAAAVVVGGSSDASASAGAAGAASAAAPATPAASTAAATGEMLHAAEQATVALKALVRAVRPDAAAADAS